MTTDKIATLIKKVQDNTATPQEKLEVLWTLNQSVEKLNNLTKSLAQIIEDEKAIENIQKGLAGNK